jgi:hypothetical protein
LILSAAGCSIKPQFFGKTELDESLLKYRNAQAIEWLAYREGDRHPDYRESILKEDPSRGIGLKPANSEGGGAAMVPPKTNFRVFLFMGQSNMVGHGRAGKLDPPYSEPHSRIRIWAKGEWQYLVPKKNFGPEVSFAHEMANVFPNDTIGIIKVAVGGTGMNSWKPDWEWSAASKTGDALKGSLYRDMINAVAAAHQVSEFQLSGFIWKQGGRDAKKSELSETYQERFVELVEYMRADLAVPELPVFVLTYFDEKGIMENRKILEKVRPNALPLYLSKARVSEYLPNAYPIFHGKLPTVLDQVHFNSDGQILLGQMTAREVTRYYFTREPEEKPNTSRKIVTPPVPN